MRAHSLLALVALTFLVWPLVTQAAPTECYARFEGVDHDKQHYDISCRDGDPTCDADGHVNGTCTTRLRVCALGKGTASCHDHGSLPLELKGGHLPLPRRHANKRTCGGQIDFHVRLGAGGDKPNATLLQLFTGKKQHPRTFDRLDLHCLPAG